MASSYFTLSDNSQLRLSDWSPDGQTPGYELQRFVGSASSPSPIGPAYHYANPGLAGLPIVISPSDGAWVAAFHIDGSKDSVHLAMGETDGTIREPTPLGPGLAGDTDVRQTLHNIGNGGFLVAYEGQNSPRGPSAYQVFDTNGVQVRAGAVDGYQLFARPGPSDDYTVTWIRGAPGANAGFATQVMDGPTPTSANLAGNDQSISELITGSGADTLTAAHQADILTGGSGADVFAFSVTPWSAGHVTDFTVGQDRLDLSALFKASGYAGGDPVADQYVSFSGDGAGGTRVSYDPDGPASGSPYPFLITTLDNVSVTQWAQTSGPSSQPAPEARLRFIDTSVSAPEGNSGDTLFAFKVQIGDPNWRTGVSGTYVVSAGAGSSPASADDFSGATWYSGRIDVPPGQTATAVVPIRGDLLVETDETFQVTLYVDGRATDSATGTIQNDDAGGRTVSGNDSGPSILSGGAGADTLTASHQPDTLTGAGGGDVFAFKVLPWSAGHVTDFAIGQDRLDLSALFQASGYSGNDPVRDGFVSFASDGADGTRVYYDTDGPASGSPYPFLITTLDHVAPANALTWAAVSGGAGSPTPPDAVQAKSGNDSAPSNLSGGAGADTLTAQHQPDVLTGAGGADHFVFDVLPWSAGHVTDFTPGTDVLDLRPLFQGSGYAGADPVADGRLAFVSDGQGDTRVYVDVDGPSGAQYPFLITTLDHVSPGQLSSSDWLFH